MARKLLQLILTAALLLLTAAWAPPRSPDKAVTQPVLVEASPAPGALLGAPPEAVELRFDRALSDEGTWLRVSTLEGERLGEGEDIVEMSNRLVLRMEIPPLPEGRYRVSYQAASVGGSTLSAGSYEFAVDLPEPRLELRQPVNGQSFDGSSVPLRMRVHFFDFDMFDNRIHVYLDGEKVQEARSQLVTLEGIEPGVHEVRVVLARLEDEELAETAQHVTVAVARPAPEAAADGGSGTGAEASLALSVMDRLSLSGERWPIATLLAVVLLAAGFVLGRAARPPVEYPELNEPPEG